MKKVKLLLMAMVVGLVYSCSKSNMVEPVSVMDSPHKKDTTINNSIPRIPLRN